MGLRWQPIGSQTGLHKVDHLGLREGRTLLLNKSRSEVKYIQAPIGRAWVQAYVRLERDTRLYQRLLRVRRGRRSPDTAFKKCLQA